MSKKNKDFRKRLSLQNQNLGKNKLNEVLENMGLDKPEEEKEVTEEEDPLKYFSQQQRKKEKEEEAKKYLKPILEEEDPLKYFEKNKEKEAEDEDPLKFVKNKEEKASDSLPKIMGTMISEELNEKSLSEKIKNNDIPVSEKYTMEERKKKMEKRYKTSLRLSQRKGFEARAKDKLMQRLQNYKNNLVNAGDTIKNNEKKPGFINEKYIKKIEQEIEKVRNESPENSNIKKEEVLIEKNINKIVKNNEIGLISKTSKSNNIQKEEEEDIESIKEKLRNAVLNKNNTNKETNNIDGDNNSNSLIKEEKTYSSSSFSKSNLPPNVNVYKYEVIKSSDPNGNGESIKTEIRYSTQSYEVNKTITKQSTEKINEEKYPNENLKK